MTDEFQQELRWLLKDKYGLSEEKILALLNDHVTQGSEIEKDISRLKAGEPLAYVIGWAPFLGLKIDLSQRTLIPRPETEFWVEQFIQEVLREKPTKKLEILDLCTGSGCITAAVLHHLPNTHVTAVDIDPKAVEQTRINLQSLNVSPDRWQILQSDLFEKVSGQFDYVLTNPPYVDPFGEFSPSVHHEPQHAIFAQKNGIELIEKIIFNIKKYLKTEGKMWLEFGEGQSAFIEELCNKEGLSVRIQPDQFGKHRYAIVSF
jgi:release factor glutamine methyltransferase